MQISAWLQSPSPTPVSCPGSLCTKDLMLHTHWAGAWRQGPPSLPLEVSTAAAGEREVTQSLTQYGNDQRNSPTPQHSLSRQPEMWSLGDMFFSPECHCC